MEANVLCRCCGETKPRSAFYRPPIGAATAPRCRKCFVKYRCSHFARVKAALVNYKGGKCEMCGFTGHPSMFDFHHSDPNAKEFAISAKHGRNIWSLIAEVDKCQLLCACCHRGVHASRETWDFDWSTEEVPSKSDLKTCVSCGAQRKHGHTYCSGRCSSQSREKAEWPDNLSELVAETSKSHVARVLGVSATAVSRRLKRLSR